MKNKLIFDSWKRVEPNAAVQASMLGNILSRTNSSGNSKGKVTDINKTFNWRKLAPFAASLVLVLAVAILLMNMNSGNGDFLLARSDDKLKVRYVVDAPDDHTSYELINLTENEIFHNYDTDIFRGTVKEVRNIEVDYNGSIDYRAVVKVEVGQVYRGSRNSGDVVSILLPGPVSASVWVEDTGVTSCIEAGMTGIFMPLKYDEASFREENGVKLCLLDLAEYGFLDGERFAFLETAEGLVFSRWAYTSLESAQTLDDVERYIKTMIN